MLETLQSCVVVGGPVALAYHRGFSPAVRIDAVCKTVDNATLIGKANLETISTLSPERQKEVANAKDQQRALWDTKLDANHVRAELRGASFLERHVIPNYTCVRGEDVLTLRDIERKAYAYEQDILATSRKAKGLAMEQLAEAAAQATTLPQPQSSSFAQNVSSFDVDLESGTRGT